MRQILFAIIAILFIFWLIGFILHFGGWLIHLVLIVCGILFIYQWVTGKRIV